MERTVRSTVPLVVLVLAISSCGRTQEVARSDPGSPGEPVLACIDGEETLAMLAEIDSSFSGYPSPREATAAALVSTGVWETGDPRLTTTEIGAVWTVAFEERTIMIATVDAHNEGWIAGQVEFCSPTGFDPGTPPPKIPVDVLTVELESAEERWVAAGISDYELVIEFGCFCGPPRRGPFTVSVHGGEVTDVFLDGEAAAAIGHDPDQPFQPLPSITPTHAFTVEGLFAEIRSNLEADRMTVTYGDYGNPTHIDIDPDLDTIDDELTIIAVLTVS